VRWRRERREGVNRRKLVVMFAVVDLGEMPNTNPLLWSKFHGSNHLVRMGLVGVIPEIDIIHVLNFYQTMGKVVVGFNTFLLTPRSPL
jgi:hypothetical protein